MKIVRLSVAKMTMPQLCAEVAETREPVTVTRRGQALVQIRPIDACALTMQQRRTAYNARHAGQERPDREDFEPAPRSPDTPGGRFDG